VRRRFVLVLTLLASLLQVQLDHACINCTDRPTAKPAADVGWGLGWGLEQTSDGLAIWHWGDNPGFKAYVTANVAARRGFVYFTNGDAGLSIRDRLVGIVLGGKHPALAQVQYRQVGQPGGARSGPRPVLPGAPAVSRPSRLPQALPSADWAHADPGVAGWSKDALAESATLAQSIGSAAILVVDNGHVVWEWGDTTRKYQCHSVRKSLLSALYGQAVARKQIDLSRTLAALGIDDDPPALSAAEKRATVRDLLMARSGVYHPAVYETAGMAASRPARESHAPGTFWYYNNWDFNALGTIYERETRTTICDAFRTQIAVPIRLQDYAAGDCTIFRGPASRHTAYPFRMSSRDLARVGLLFMNKGRWDGKEIVPPSWVDESTKPWTDLGIRGGYGYMWWAARNGDHYPFLKLPDGTFSARGVGEQNLVVIPAWGLVIVHRTNTDAGDPTITVTDFGGLLQKILSARR
jgi:CubicO group peptidase (beta-lactamase class C family)